MAGVTDLPFRTLCRELGAGLVVAEMISSNPRLRDSRKTRWRSRHDGEPEPRAIQIAGSEPAQLAEAARYNAARGAQIIDINMGCPARKVCRKAAGSALLADEALVGDILRAVVAAVDVPVTLKIRTGAAPGARNGVSIARIAEDAGVSALAVHGRTRACAFRGEAEYDTIAHIVESVSIPVWANGDIDSPQKARAVLDHTGAAGVMIGRAAQGRPWLCGQIGAYLDSGVIPADPTAATRQALLRRHVEGLHGFYGEFMGLRIARKHVGWFLQYEHGRRAVRGGQFNALETAADQLHFIDTLYPTTEHEDLAA
jgi:tRNA-dihydrouridine synthase B